MAVVDAGVGLPSYLDNIAAVKDAALIDWQALNGERETLMAGLQELTKEVEVLQKEEPTENDRFPQVMQAFLDHALNKAKKMKKKYLEAQELIEDLLSVRRDTCRACSLIRVDVC
jgi:hemerythrin superfamily protein